MKHDQNLNISTHNTHEDSSNSLYYSLSHPKSFWYECFTSVYSCADRVPLTVSMSSHTAIVAIGSEVLLTADKDSWRPTQEPVKIKTEIVELRLINTYSSAPPCDMPTVPPGARSYFMPLNVRPDSFDRPHASSGQMVRF